MLDSRFDFIYFFNINKILYESGIDVSSFNLTTISNLKTKLTKFKNSEVFLEDNEIFFFKKRLKYDFNEKYEEFVIIPSFNNPRWIIKNKQKYIKEHGMIIKPSSMKAKTIWYLAKIFNKFGLFNLVFSNRFLVKKNILEKNLLGKKHNDKEIEIIYTGSPGKFQKFTCKIRDKFSNNIYFLKIGIQKYSKIRIEKESDALQLLTNCNFDFIVVPNIIKDVNNHNIRGILLNNIITNDKYMKELVEQDLIVIAELYNKVGIEKTNLGNILNTNEFPSDILNKKVYIGYSHGDYIPWNRFVSGKFVKIIDWELGKYRILFYDLFTIIIITNILKKKKISFIIDECTLNVLKILRYMTNKNILLTRNEILIYLYVAVSDLYSHYIESVMENLDNKVINGLSQILDNIKKRLKM